MWSIAKNMLESPLSSRCQGTSLTPAALCPSQHSQPLMGIKERWVCAPVPVYLKMCSSHTSNRNRHLKLRISVMWQHKTSETLFILTGFYVAKNDIHIHSQNSADTAGCKWQKWFSFFLNPWDKEVTDLIKNQQRGGGGKEGIGTGQGWQGSTTSVATERKCDTWPCPWCE